MAPAGGSDGRGARLVPARSSAANAACPPSVSMTCQPPDSTSSAMPSPVPGDCREDSARQKRSDEEHLRIFHAIRDGAADEAEAAMQDHLAAVRGALGAITGE